MSDQELSVVQIEYVNGRCTTDVVLCSANRVAELIGGTGTTTVGVASRDYDWLLFATRDSGDLIVRADQVAWMRARPLDPDETLATWAERQRAFRDAEGGGR